MTTNLHRRSIRLPEFDYTQPGAYFITLVTFNRTHLFGEIVDGEFRSTPLGVIARREWFKTAELRSNITLSEDEFVVMPNHIHGIIHLEECTSNANPVKAQQRCAGTQQRCAGTQQRCAPTPFQPIQSASLGAVVRAYKSAVTYAAHKENFHLGEAIWQRNYYEHIIRNELDFQHIQDYILNNPAAWQEDEEYQ